MTACQFATTAVFVWVMGLLGKIDVEPLRPAKVRQMAPINIVFYLAIFTNGQVLKHATVETSVLGAAPHPARSRRARSWYEQGRVALEMTRIIQLVL